MYNADNMHNLCCDVSSSKAVVDASVYDLFTIGVQVKELDRLSKRISDYVTPLDPDISNQTPEQVIQYAQSTYKYLKFLERILKDRGLAVVHLYNIKLDTLIDKYNNVEREHTSCLKDFNANKGKSTEVDNFYQFALSESEKYKLDLMRDIIVLSKQVVIDFAPDLEKWELIGRSRKLLERLNALEDEFNSRDTMQKEGIDYPVDAGDIESSIANSSDLKRLRLHKTKLQELLKCCDDTQDEIVMELAPLDSVTNSTKLPELLLVMNNLIKEIKNMLPDTEELVRPIEGKPGVAELSVPNEVVDTALWSRIVDFDRIIADIGNNLVPTNPQANSIVGMYDGDTANNGDLVESNSVEVTGNRLSSIKEEVEDTTQIVQDVMTDIDSMVEDMSNSIVVNQGIDQAASLIGMYDGDAANNVDFVESNSVEVTVNKLSSMQEEVEDATQILQGVMNHLVGRSERIDALLDRADKLEASSKEFERLSRRVSRKMKRNWSKDKALLCCAVGCVISAVCSVVFFSTDFLGGGKVEFALQLSSLSVTGLFIIAGIVSHKLCASRGTLSDIELDKPHSNFLSAS